MEYAVLVRRVLQQSCVKSQMRQSLDRLSVALLFNAAKINTHPAFGVEPTKPVLSDCLFIYFRIDDHKADVFCHRV